MNLTDRLTRLTLLANAAGDAKAKRFCATARFELFRMNDPDTANFLLELAEARLNA